MKINTGKLDAIIEKKMLDAIDAGLDEIIKELQEYVKKWRRQPTFSKVITGTYPNIKGKVVVSDMMVGGVERWHAIDKGIATAPNGINQIALGRKNPMIFPLPYQPKSYAPNGSGGGPGRGGETQYRMIIGPRSIEARNWTKAVKSKQSKIKAAMKSKIKK